MIMISRDEFAALHNPSLRSASATPMQSGAALTWPANEIMLQSLIRTGRSTGDIATLYGVESESIAARRRELDL